LGRISTQCAKELAEYRGPNRQGRRRFPVFLSFRATHDFMPMAPGLAELKVEWEACDYEVVIEKKDL